ncbi:hypothetical protein CYMTET_52376 [Cymbomonas tetramitiformis]|uniref:Uncharacterized protein n=1 Tax=Cymbomonas tetramitiformis TaxID=36881 RepID=A0AAE0ER58_9CHLO|nr:hypothetical protein CYMTET_52376 [Cymbomonas tetramitiformis]
MGLFKAGKYGRGGLAWVILLCESRGELEVKVGLAEDKKTQEEEFKETVECATCRQKEDSAGSRFLTNQDKRDAFLQGRRELGAKIMRRVREYEAEGKLKSAVALALVSAGKGVFPGIADTAEAVLPLAKVEPVKTVHPSPDPDFKGVTFSVPSRPLRNGGLKSRCSHALHLGLVCNRLVKPGVVSVKSAYLLQQKYISAVVTRYGLDEAESGSLPVAVPGTMINSVRSSILTPPTGLCQGS